MMIGNDDDPPAAASLTATTAKEMTIDDKFIIRVKNVEGEQVLFRVKQSTKMKRIFEEYGKLKGIDNICSTAMNFRFDNKDIQPDDTAASLGLQENDIIEFLNETTDDIMTIDEGEGPIIIRVKKNNRGGEETHFKINQSTKMQHVFKAYAQRQGINVTADMNFTFHGKNVQPDKTAAALGLKENDIIAFLTNNKSPSSKFKELQLFNNFTHCSHCNLPPYNSQHKLLICSNCVSASYHSTHCQRAHWKIHKQSCAQSSQSLLPLKELVRWNKLFKSMKQQQQHHHCGGTKTKEKKQLLVWCWWHPDNENGITNDTLQHTNHIWKMAVEQHWNNQDYLRAMEGMQFALEAYQSAWPYIGKGSGSFDEIRNVYDDDNDKSCSEQGKKKKSDDLLDGDDTNEKGNEEEGEGEDFFETSMVLARRLLFLAYCELDGGQISSARQRLVQCISITNTILYSSSHKPHGTNQSAQSILNDAYMELMLSMEEVESDKILAKHVANLAIANGNCCGWVDPMQRPGYMSSSRPQLSSVSLCPFGERPLWCNELERNYDKILEEYYNLRRDTMMMSQWMDVGCGKRGSGHDDHSVVSGRGWKEYVLFGTGAFDRDDDAPFTKKLLRQHVPDAVTLAREGGGEVIFSRLSPRTHIKPHCGPTNLRWTAHLALVVPKSKSDCRIRIGNEWRSWSAGEILLFDDSFEHEVRNDTDEDRVVMLIRLWHPELMPRTGLASQMVAEAIAKREESVQKRYYPPI